MQLHLHSRNCGVRGGVFVLMFVPLWAPLDDNARNLVCASGDELVDGMSQMSQLDHDVLDVVPVFVSMWAPPPLLLFGLLGGDGFFSVTVWSLVTTVSVGSIGLIEKGRWL